MMQHKFLLFSAVCCCLLQAMLCDPPPTAAMFRPRFLRKSSLPPTTESNQNNVLDSNTSSSPIKQAESAEVSSKDGALAEFGPSEEAVEKKGTSPKKTLSTAVSRINSNSKDPLDIEDRDELKERSKELLLDLLRNKNANKAITFMATNVKDLLENKVTSSIIITHTRLVKETLTNVEAKEIIKDVRLNIFNTFTNPLTPYNVEVALEYTRQLLSRKYLPDLLKKRFKIVKKIINCKKIYSAAETLKKTLVKFLNSSDVKIKIAKGFKLLDFAIHFDPNNVLQSLIG